MKIYLLSVCVSNAFAFTLIRTKYAVKKIRGKPKNCVLGLFPTLAGRKTGWQFLEGARLSWVLQRLAGFWVLWFSEIPQGYNGWLWHAALAWETLSFTCFDWIQYFFFSESQAYLHYPRCGWRCILEGFRDVCSYWKNKIQSAIIVKLGKEIHAEFSSRKVRVQWCGMGDKVSRTHNGDRGSVRALVPVVSQLSYRKQWKNRNSWVQTPIPKFTNYKFRKLRQVLKPTNKIKIRTTYSLTKITPFPKIS